MSRFYRQCEEMQRLALPHSRDLPFLIESPYVRYTLGKIVTEYFPRCLPHVVITSSQYNHICIQLGPVFKYHSFLHNFRDLLPLFDFHFTTYNHLRTPNIDVISPASDEVFHKQSRPLIPIIDLESSLFETCQHFLVIVCNQLCNILLDRLENWIWDTGKG